MYGLLAMYIYRKWQKSCARSKRNKFPYFLFFLFLICRDCFFFFSNFVFLSFFLFFFVYIFFLPIFISANARNQEQEPHTHTNIERERERVELLGPPKDPIAPTQFPPIFPVFSFASSFSLFYFISFFFCCPAPLALVALLFPHIGKYPWIGMYGSSSSQPPISTISIHPPKAGNHPYRTKIYTRQKERKKTKPESEDEMK